MADGKLPSGLHLVLEPGNYELVPEAHVDSTCGNCEDPRTRVAATVGLIISGQEINLCGGGDDPAQVVIQTGAGYGLLFRDCDGCVLANLTVTGGVRDRDGNATDAAVVAQHSSLRVEGCVLRDNLGDSTVVAQTVVGVMGIAGREGARLEILHNRIERNSWDGIALYRDAEAVIVDNIVDGVDKATGPRLGGGRGVGIGLTWNARAEVQRNLVTRYWKGIGVFVDAQAVVRHNIIEDVITWGVAYWDAGRGKPVAAIRENVIYRTGACGIALTREAGGLPAAGECTGNLIVRTGQNPKYDDPEYYCPQCPLAVSALPEDFLIADNLLCSNRRMPADDLADGDLALPEFRRAAAPLLSTLAGWPALESARCWRELRGGGE
jgi:hypothetical protein